MHRRLTMTRCRTGSGKMTSVAICLFAVVVALRGLHTPTTILPVRSPWLRRQRPAARPTCCRAWLRAGSPGSPRTADGGARSAGAGHQHRHGERRASRCRRLHPPPRLDRQHGQSAHHAKGRLPPGGFHAGVERCGGSRHPGGPSIDRRGERPGADRASQERARGCPLVMPASAPRRICRWKPSAAWPVSRSPWCRSRAAARRSREYSADRCPSCSAPPSASCPHVRSGRLPSLSRCGRRWRQAGAGDCRRVRPAWF